MKCYECNGKLQRKRVRHVHHGADLGKIEAEVCNRCGEQFFGEAVFDALEKAARKEGVWGLASKTRIGQSGNNLDIRVSNPIARFMGLSKGREVIIRPQGKKRLVVEVI